MALSQATLEKILAKMDSIDASALKPKKDPEKVSSVEKEEAPKEASPARPGGDEAPKSPDEDEDLDELMELYGKRSGKLD